MHSEHAWEWVDHSHSLQIRVDEHGVTKGKVPLPNDNDKAVMHNLFCLPEEKRLVKDFSEDRELQNLLECAAKCGHDLIKAVLLSLALTKE